MVAFCRSMIMFTPPPPVRASREMLLGAPVVWFRAAT